MKSNRGAVRKVATISVAICCIIFLADCVNILQVFGIGIKNINWDLESVVMSTILAITLYCITYILIDSYNVKRQQNQRKCALFLMKSIYEACLQNITFLDNSDIKESIIKKMDFDKLSTADDPDMKFKKMPFESENMIFDYIRDGVITVEEFKSYLDIKEKYNSYITMSLIFFDAPYTWELSRAKAVDMLNEKIKNISEEN